MKTSKLVKRLNAVSIGIAATMTVCTIALGVAGAVLASPPVAASAGFSALMTFLAWQMCD